MLSSLRLAAERYAETALIAGLGLVTVLHLTAPLAGLPFVIPKDPNEGWNAFQALAVASHKPLYPHPLALIANNYPPLSFYIMAAVGHVLNDNIVAGRIVALVSFFIVGANIVLITRRLHASLQSAIFSGLLFMGYASAHYSGYVAMNDPQWLAHAFMTTGFLLFVGRGDRVSMLVASSLFVFAGGMIKHSLIPLPVAITVWLFIYDRPQFYSWVIIGVALVAASTVAMYLAYGPPFFSGVFGTPRGYSIARLFSETREVAPPLLFLLPAPIVLMLVDSRPEARLVLLYAVVSAAWGVFILGGDGVDVNAVFDLVIALSMNAALAIDTLGQWASSPNRSVARFSGMLIFVLPVLLVTPRAASETWEYLQDLKSAIQTSREDVQYLSSFRGSAMCESLALCYWSGKDFEVDIFNTGEKLLAGTMSDELLIENIENKRFDVI